MPGQKEKNTAGLSEIEQAAMSLLQQDDEGMIDNVWDIVDELMEIETQLPADSPVREQWDAFYESCEEIMRGSS